ncbi:MAG: tsaB [Ignavibacteria bacterium]|nr:tsaB [Ignavibacteria bacterium]
MKLLSIETSGSVCAIALSENESILATYSVNGHNMHDRLLAELTKRILADNKLSFDDIDAIAVSSGPGSFTGLRIGAAFAKGICFSETPKLISVPTLSAFAYAAKEFSALLGNYQICVVVPSHKDLVYYQFFNINAEALSEIFQGTIEELLKASTGQTFYCGPGAHNLPYGMKNYPYWLLNAEFIAHLGYMYYLEGHFVTAAEFVPLYIQEFVPKYEVGEFK